MYFYSVFQSKWAKKTFLHNIFQKFPCSLCAMHMARCVRCQKFLFIFFCSLYAFPNTIAFVKCIYNAIVIVRSTILLVVTAVFSFMLLQLRQNNSKVLHFYLITHVLCKLKIRLKWFEIVFRLPAKCISINSLRKSIVSSHHHLGKWWFQYVDLLRVFRNINRNKKRLILDLGLLNAHRKSIHLSG